MGRSTTPRYRLELKGTGGTFPPQSWNKRAGGPLTPTDAELRRWVESFEASTRKGGSNAHLGPTVIWSAQVVRQKDGQVIARYSGPLFAVVD